MCRPFMPACPSAVQCFGRERLGTTREPTYRLYNCQCCAVQVRICQSCDHGNIYCAGGCAQIRRRESQRRIQARYQKSRGGASRHAARQQRWRGRRRGEQKIVTHQGSPVTVIQCIVALEPVIRSEPSDASAVEPEQRQKIRPPHDRCAFCGAALSEWTRQRPWRWSG